MIYAFYFIQKSCDVTNSFVQPSKTRNSPDRWKLVEDLTNVVWAGDFKIGYIDLNFQAQLR